jgi:hypothetical protein
VELKETKAQLKIWYYDQEVTVIGESLTEYLVISNDMQELTIPKYPELERGLNKYFQNSKT